MEPDVQEPWWKKWGKYILMGLLAILTLGATVVMAKRQPTTKDLANDLDTIDKNHIGDKIVADQKLQVNIEQEQQVAEEVAQQGQAAFQQVAKESEQADGSQQIANFNKGQKKRRTGE